jgi:hypothetical protein
MGLTGEVFSSGISAIACQLCPPKRLLWNQIRAKRKGTRAEPRMTRKLGVMID